LKTTFLGLALGLILQSATLVAHAETTTQVQILSATVRDQKIAGAGVILQKNGEESVVATTDAEGHAPLRELAATDPAALLIVRKSGYSDLVAKCPCAGMTYALSPIMDKLDGMRIVLNWGAHPSDLDGHLAYPGNHIFFQHKDGTDALQDVDEIHGYGPETITMVRKHPGERYVYAVHDYWDKSSPETPALSASEAKVFVYVGQTLIRTYYVPKGLKGNIWTVFAISEDGELQDINTMSGSFSQSTSDITTDLIFGHGSHQAATVATASPIPESAHKLNTQGESEYAAGNYAKAIELFQAAIALDDNYGQAYSNLGLTFNKAGRVAEALWANRKAIALASGPHAPQVRASTHFNNGHIYEDKQQWDDALREYRAAESEESNAVYQNAIARTQQHGAH
jgi:tetratricopeptide repeat protein